MAEGRPPLGDFKAKDGVALMASSTASQLRLVGDPPSNAASVNSRDPTRRIFERWALMNGHSLARCKLGPTRRVAINGALAMGYDAQFILLAVDGMAGDPLEDCRNDGTRAAMRELEWLLAAESRIERWAAKGELLRQRAMASSIPADADDGAEPLDEAAEAEARARCVSLARQMREGWRG